MSECRDFGFDVVPGHNGNDHGTGDGGEGWTREWAEREPMPEPLPDEGCER